MGPEGATAWPLTAQVEVAMVTAQAEVVRAQEEAVMVSAAVVRAQEAAATAWVRAGAAGRRRWRRSRRSSS